MNVISSNLKRLRSISGLSQDKAAQGADLSRVAYRNLETGKSEPRASNLQKLAEVFGVNVQELVTPPPLMRSLRFRTHNILTRKEKSKREQIVHEVAIWLKDFNSLENLLKDKIPYALQNLSQKFSSSNERPRQLAFLVRETLGMGPDEMISDICGLLESAGIKMRLIEADFDKFSGLSIAEEDGGPAIGVNIASFINVERQIFTAAHELGHLLLHIDSFNAEEKNEVQSHEREADQFAEFFLMPEQAFIKIWDKNRGLHWFDNILQTKRIFRVGYETVLSRLISMGKADSSISKDFINIYQQRYRQKLAKHIEPFALARPDFLEDRLSRLVRNAFEKELISINRAAEILQINIEVMRERVNAWKKIA